MKRHLKILTVLILILSASIALPRGVAAKIGPVSFDDLVKRSEYVVVGKVQSVQNVEQVKVAKIEVMRVLKGTPTSELYYLAQSTWICDISGAEVGETALFFLTKYQFDPNPKPRPTPDANGFVTLSSDFEEPLGFRNQVQALVNGTPFLQISDAGRGKMPLRKIAGIDYVTIWTDDVRLPKEIKTVAGPEPEYDFIRSARFDEVIKRAEKILSSRTAKM
jgi:hypothetical protein